MGKFDHPSRSDDPTPPQSHLEKTHCVRLENLSAGDRLWIGLGGERLGRMRSCPAGRAYD